MTKLIISSDLHLGHDNIIKFRNEFSSAEAHHETVFDRLATAADKRDSLYLLGDVAFTVDWLLRIANIRCVKKTLILGNHDTDQKIPLSLFLSVFDSVHSLHSRRNVWFSHCPIHDSQFRGKTLNIHGHDHKGIIDDPRYFNVCLEHNDYRPISFGDIHGKVAKRQMTYSS